MTNDLNNNFTPKKVTKKIGVVLIILSCVIYSGLIIVPFLPYTIATKTVISTTLIISGEASFWIGSFILGKELVNKYKRYLNPLNWIKKRSQ